MHRYGRFCMVCMQLSHTQVGLSLKPNIVAWQDFVFPAGLTRGYTSDAATIVQIDPSLRLLVRVPGPANAEDQKAAPTPCYGSVHISQAADRHVEDLSKKFAVGQQHKCRVLGRDWLDGLAQVTLKASVLEEKYLFYGDVTPGQIISGKVKMAKEGMGIIIQLSKNVKAICKVFHLGKTQDLQRRYPVGKTVKARVCDVTSPPTPPSRKQLVQICSKILQYLPT